MENVNATCWIRVRNTLGEGPCWDAELKRFYWVDIEGHTLWWYDEKEDELSSADMGQQIGFAVPKVTDGVIVGLKDGIYEWDESSKQLDKLVELDDADGVLRFNDGKADPYGRIFAGTLHLEDEENEATLYRLDRDGTTEEMLTGLTLSNGLTWSPDHKWFYHIDTPTETVRRYPYDLSSGTFGEGEVVVEFKDEDGFPDGMTSDEEGHLWIAHFAGGRVSRWNPETGEKVLEVMVPAPNVTSCCFIGDDLKQLAITTAREGMDDEALETYPDAGSVFKIDTEVKGMPLYRFGR
ncbi:MAG: SMP-30/gluconolactonase/LRE family protein [Exiguobacterium sp.]|uniref:SMP-30/gluconolactonase/LRE family protein n=1 Tax=Exiguobacterium TaxID=33986 RepID=UPI0004A93CDA|nr:MULTISPECIES: SMP-30/gluconolactonase/LRE family protein [Exiguobacterium]MDX5322491.1 SMP-30/gluconolactonase/LRE family protein [Exiguobacterium sp.]KDN58548.1 gluconolaconase [Exiguobacterium sp. AB2]MDX5424218.1 SMP-30/gluconolactonase/LRE family protein [Exiguobacterium sp.]MDX6771737.1 SMP-30/gluconolactonase/LRE family protein [Exiguobacterium sp.]QUE85273.1 SMP-30/gluconolactonase/LRE family protein [Exiguobacterium alkaliphilum]